MTEQGKIMISVQGVDDQCEERGADDGARKNNDQCARGGRPVQGARSRLRSEKNVSWDKEDITSTQVHNWLCVYVPYDYLPGYVGWG